MTTTHTPGPMEQKLIDVFAGLTIPAGVEQGWYELRPFAREQDAIRAELLAALELLHERLTDGRSEPTGRASTSGHGK